jgi:hypothetical protein
MSLFMPSTALRSSWARTREKHITLTIRKHLVLLLALNMNQLATSGQGPQVREER